ncbi:hypothetical protein QE152_g1595 [Popillia japonica]|uniref:Uncharacterized protein n=1 Tax=Popillia japonica TaxID=7064 RepID=A0AAW1N465_POPJA
MLTGRGVHPKLEIKPNFLVCRLNVSPGNAVVNTPIELLNGCEANVNVVFEKVLELEGEMRDPVVSDHKIQQDKHKKDSSSADTKTSKIRI